MKLLGGILMAMGILIAGASGLCSLMFLFSGGTGGWNASGLGLILVVGGIPFLTGLGLFYGGRALLRRGQAEDNRP